MKQTYFMYCRKSSEAEDRQMPSIDSQLSVLKKFAAKKGLRIEEVLKEAKSAKAPGRPVFNSMMQRLYRGEADGILCWKLDRLARNPVDGGSIIWAIKENGTTIVTPFQTYGQSEDNVVLMYLEFGMAQKYVDDLSRNVKRGLKTKAESGWLPSLPPLGYINRKGPDGRNVIEKDPERFETVRKCWDLMLTGEHTPSEIRGLATTVLGLESRFGPIAGSTIYYLFSNPFYYGFYEFPKGSGIWYEGRHTPMISKEEYDKVQKLLSRAKKQPKNRYVFAYTGLLRCGGCGGFVTAEEKHQVMCPECGHKFAYRNRSVCPKCRFSVSEMPKSQFLKYTYYHCTRSSDPECPEKSIEERALQKQVFSHLKALKLPSLHHCWINRCFVRLGGQENAGVMEVIQKNLETMSPEDQREVVMVVFKEMTLKERTLTVVPSIPFSWKRDCLGGTHVPAVII